ELSCGAVAPIPVSKARYIPKMFSKPSAVTITAVFFSKGVLNENTINYGTLLLFCPQQKSLRPASLTFAKIQYFVLFHDFGEP
ncbi:MAG: hypothetical protein ACREBC_21335, partial [Pyrinomonadaceae bacterium]